MLCRATPAQRAPRGLEREEAEPEVGTDRTREDVRGLAEPPYYLEHDEAGNIAPIVDRLRGVTTQTFDALGRLASRALPNGVTSTWTYDARGWVDTIVHREPATEGGDVIASVDYTRSVSGSRSSTTRARVWRARSTRRWSMRTG